MISRIGFVWLMLMMILSNSLVFAQNFQEADSLKKCLKNLGGRQDSLQFEILKSLAFCEPNPVESLVYANQALFLARQMNDVVRVARALEEVGLSQRVLGNKIESLEASLQALSIYDSLNMEDQMATMYVQLGSHYALELNYTQAISLLAKGKAIYKRLGIEYEVASVNINIGETYRLMNQKDSAIYYFHQALAFDQPNNNEVIQGYAIGNIGMTYAQFQEYDTAQKLLVRAIALLTDLGDPYSVSIFKSELGMIYLRQDQMKKAWMLLDEAYHLALNNGLKEQIRDSGLKLATYYTQTGDYREALQYTLIHHTYKDSLINLENVTKLEQLKANYEYQKRDREIAAKQTEIEQSVYQRNIILIISGLLFIILVISLLAFIRTKRDHQKLAIQKSEIAERESQKQWLLKELQHRTKNNLQMISSLLNLQSIGLVGHPSYEAIKEGQARVDAMAIIHQRLYQDGSQLRINVRDYLEELVSNLVYSFNPKVTVESKIEISDMDVDKAIPLALIVNEMVTNSLKYAFSDHSNPRILIALFRNKHELVLEVADNGPGIFDQKEINGHSFGLKLITTLSAQLKGEINHQKKSTGCHWKVKFEYHNIS